ncbi:Protein of unknown function [Gryllus bimaculatus]|nr:Protein of unknown function [Gryllus bimaculatus]
MLLQPTTTTTTSTTTTCPDAVVAPGGSGGGGGGGVGGAATVAAVAAAAVGAAAAAQVQDLQRALKKDWSVHQGADGRLYYCKERSSSPSANRPWRPTPSDASRRPTQRDATQRNTAYNGALQRGAAPQAATLECADRAAPPPPPSQRQPTRSRGTAACDGRAFIRCALGRVRVHRGQVDRKPVDRCA